MVTHEQLVALGFTESAIEHRIEKGRLHPKTRGVYAVGRPELTRYGLWMAAVLSCGPGAALSHDDAAALYGIRSRTGRKVDVSVPSSSRRRRPGIRIHRRRSLEAGDLTAHHGIPVTSIVLTMLDLAARHSRPVIEASINAADEHDLIDPESLRAALASRAGEPGVATLRRVLERRTFRLTDSGLERRCSSHEPGCHRR